MVERDLSITAEFIEKYGVTIHLICMPQDFIHFIGGSQMGDTVEHATALARFEPPALPLYQELYSIVMIKDYFVLTTNVDHQFYKAGFSGRKKYLRHRVITERFSVREDAIQRLMTQKNYSERWMPGEGTV